MIKDIRLISLRKSDDIKEAMQRIAKSGLGIVLIVNKDKELIGVATDGDIRRAVSAGKK